MKYLRVGELISILNSFEDKNLPVLVTDVGKDHQFPLEGKYIKIIKEPYFPNDSSENEFSNDKQYVNLGYF